VLRISTKPRAPTSIDQIGFSPAVTTKLRHLLERPSASCLSRGPPARARPRRSMRRLMTIYRPEIRILTAEDPIRVHLRAVQPVRGQRSIGIPSPATSGVPPHDPKYHGGRDPRPGSAQIGFAPPRRATCCSARCTRTMRSRVAAPARFEGGSNVIASSLIGVSRSGSCARSARVQAGYDPPRIWSGSSSTHPRADEVLPGAGARAAISPGFRGAWRGELWVPSERDVILITKNAPFEEIRASARTARCDGRDVMTRLTEGRTRSRN